MITEKTHQFVRAYFTNNERTIARAEWLNTKENKLDTEVIVCKEGEFEWDRLLTHITIDDLHEATYNWYREQRQGFEEEIIRIGKANGLIVDLDVVNSDLYKIFCKLMFEKQEDEKQEKEKLFMFKLALFEQDVIKESDNRELKAKLRKAETLLEALKISCEIAQD